MKKMIVLRPSKKSCIIFGLFGLVPFIAGLDAEVHFGEWRQAVIFMLFGSILSLGPALRYRISWDEQILVYRGLVSSAVLSFSEVKKFEIKGPYYKYNWGPTIGMAIFLHESSQNPVMIINIKPFSRGDIKLLIDRISEAIYKSKSTGPISSAIDDQSMS